MAAERTHELAQKDFKEIVGRADSMLKDAGIAVSADYAERWFAAESAMNPELARAFDHRNDSPQHKTAFNQLIKKASDKLMESARREPDPEVTADRNAVAAAVKGVTSKMTPEKPANYGSMSDAEFAKEKARWGV